MDKQSLKYLIGGALVGVGVYAGVDQIRKRLTGPNKKNDVNPSSSTNALTPNNQSPNISSSGSSTPLSGSRRRMASQDDLPEREKRKDNKPVVVWVDGVFDMMHFGHANMLRQAKALGDKLIVGVNSDESVLKEKGFLPVMNETERVVAVQGCKWTDEVVPCKLFIQQKKKKKIEAQNRLNKIIILSKFVFFALNFFFFKIKKPNDLKF